MQGVLRPTVSQIVQPSAIGKRTKPNKQLRQSLRDSARSITAIAANNCLASLALLVKERHSLALIRQVSPQQQRLHLHSITLTASKAGQRVAGAGVIVQAEAIPG